ncbi:MAG: Gfo/Idh/MocA family oxidoreductase [Ginsengibacter sp.]
MNEKRFGFGIVGAGMISHFHARAIAAIKNAVLVGVYNINKDKSDQFAGKHHCIAYTALEEMLSNPEIDIVCICTPSGIHLDPALKSIKAGKHCLIEKPLEVTLERCDRIIEAAKKKGVRVGVIFPSRFYENSKQLKSAIDQKRFGDLVLGDAYVKWSRSAAYYQSGKWRGTWKYDGGGALMNQGIHSVDLLQWYMGPVESVRSVAANIQHKNIEVEDTIVSTLKFANGALGTIESTTAVFPGTLKRIEIMGTEGTAILEESNLIKWEFTKKNSEDKIINDELAKANISHGGVSDPADINFAGHQKQIEDMMHSIEKGDDPLIDALEGRKSVEIVLAIYESARSGHEIRLPLAL